MVLINLQHLGSTCKKISEMGRGRAHPHTTIALLCSSTKRNWRHFYERKKDLGQFQKKINIRNFAKKKRYIHCKYAYSVSNSCDAFWHGAIFRAHIYPKCHFLTYSLLILHISVCFVSWKSNNSQTIYSRIISPGRCIERHLAG